MRLLSAFSTLLLLVALAPGACTSGGQSDDAGAWEAVRDTVGDTVVVRTVSGSVWRDTARLVPDVSVGVLDGPEEYIFGNVVSLARGDDGTLYVMDRQVPALRVYDPDGSYRTTFGGEGGGPGEYQRPDGGLNVLSDGRVVLRDPGNGRIQVYSPEGESVATWRHRGGFFTSRRMVVDEEDRSHALILLDPEASVDEWETALVQILPDGSYGDTLRIPDTEWEEPTLEAVRDSGEGERSMSVTNVPFTPREQATLSPRGYFIHGISTDYTLTLRKPSGPLRIEKSYQPVPVQAGEKEEEEARVIRNMRNTDPNWRWNGEPIPDVKPPYRSIYAGEDGTVWVFLHQPAARRDDPAYDPTDPRSVPDEWHEPVVFDVFDEDGRYLGPVRAPEGFSPYPEPLFTRTWVLATVRDEFDVQKVVLFDVQLPGGRSPEDVTGG